MLCMPTTVLLGFYFRRRRSLANSLTKCGVGVGAVAFPPIVTYLLDQYGLRGSLLLMGGVCLNSLAAASLLRPVSFYKNRKRPPPGDGSQKLLPPGGEGELGEKSASGTEAESLNAEISLRNEARAEKTWEELQLDEEIGQHQAACSGAEKCDGVIDKAIGNGSSGGHVVVIQEEVPPASSRQNGRKRSSLPPGPSCQVTVLSKSTPELYDLRDTASTCRPRTLSVNETGCRLKESRYSRFLQVTV